MLSFKVGSKKNSDKHRVVIRNLVNIDFDLEEHGYLPLVKASRTLSLNNDTLIGDG